MPGQAGAPEAPPLIPRAAIFGNPDKSSVQLSHDGRHLSWSAPVNGVLNVHVAPIDNLAAARPVTSATRRPIYGHIWAYDNRTIVYVDDVGGDENIRIFAVDIVTLAKRDLTPLAGMKLQTITFTPQFIKKGMDVIRGMKSLESVATGGQSGMPAAEFWKRCDKGEFKK